jgi:hypothetical protein
MSKEPTKKEPEGKIVRLVWDSAENLPALYSNQLIVTHGGESEFHIIFGHLTPPLILPESVEEIPDQIVIKPVAKIVVTPKTIKKFIEALTKNLEKYEEHVKEEKNVG